MDPLVANPENEISALPQAAEDFGIEHRYWDIFGKQHEASEDVLKTILRSLGVDTSSNESIEKAVEERHWQEWSQPLRPTLVVSQSYPGFPIAIPAQLGNSKASFVIECEDGARQEHTYFLAESPQIGKSRSQE